MSEDKTIMHEWLSTKSSRFRANLLSRAGQQIQNGASLSLEAVLQQLAAQLMVACAEDLDLSPLELAGLLRTPRKDALAGLITVLRDQEQF